MSPETSTIRKLRTFCSSCDFFSSEPDSVSCRLPGSSISQHIYVVLSWDECHVAQANGKRGQMKEGVFIEDVENIA